MKDLIIEDFPVSEIEFEKRYSNEQACMDYLAKMKWPEIIIKFAVFTLCQKPFFTIPRGICNNNSNPILIRMNHKK